MRICDDSFQRTMSIFSPPSSSTMFLMRLPRTPTHAPTASTFESIDETAIFVRCPARAPGLDLDRAIADSGTSRSKSA
jgi:hypothetical protein